MSSSLLGAANSGLALLWIVLWLVAGRACVLLLRIYKRDRAGAFWPPEPEDEPEDVEIDRVQSNVRVVRLRLEVGACVVGILLGVITLGLRLQPGGPGLTGAGLIFSAAFIAAPILMLWYCDLELRARRRMGTLAHAKRARLRALNEREKQDNEPTH